MKHFFTQHQVILYDKSKWAGRITEDFRQYQKGRVISIVRINKDEYYGIISVYAINCGNNEGSNNKRARARKKIRSKTTKIIKDITNAWSNTYSNICTIILGDLQETISDEDRDNRGTFRKKYSDDGILAATCKSHYSLIRHKNKHIPYWTRQGKIGCRGIDHILYPIDDKYANRIDTACFERDLGESCLPSDHILLSCTLISSGIKGELLDNYSLKNCFRKISAIKIKLDKDERTMSFDDNQFMNQEALDQKNFS